MSEMMHQRPEMLQWTLTCPVLGTGFMKTFTYSNDLTSSVMTVGDDNNRGGKLELETKVHPKVHNHREGPFPF